MHADTVRHLVLDDVAHAGKERLVEQCIGYQHAGHSASLATRLRSIPQRIHRMRCPVVDIVQRALDELHRARIKIQSLAVGKFQAQPRHRVGFVFVGAVTAEQQKVDAHAEMRALDQNVFAPATPRQHVLLIQTRDVLLTISGYTQNLSADKRFGLFAQDDT
ncbi:hypothetical protein FE36_02410 [Xanthomonas oryzae pv. oryzicola]|nr:hypothetical protein FE36_02410 [Xanthomonas oryzae pv. oryzicola]